MQFYHIFLAACLLQVGITTAQSSNFRYSRRRNGPRKNAETAAPTSLLPAFFTRAFGTGSESADKAKVSRSPRQRTSRRPIQQWGGPVMRQFRRPFVHPGTAASFAGFPGAGPYAAGAISRRRNFVEASSPRITPLPVSFSSMMPISSRSPGFTMMPAGSDVVPVKTVAPAGLVQAQSRLTTPPLSLDGWLSYPTEAPVTTTTKVHPTVTGKEGTCGSAPSYGIKCRQRMDQCSEDKHCPGSTRCCMVADCGYMCVKPKASSPVPKKKKWGGASSVLKRQREAEEAVESSTTAMGLKLNDIAVAKKRVPSRTL